MCFDLPEIGFRTDGFSVDGYSCVNVEVKVQPLWMLLVDGFFEIAVVDCLGEGAENLSLLSLRRHDDPIAVVC